MQVIFIKDLKKQGKKGEIKTVKDGYAQNYLIKNGYAIPVNEHNLNELNNQNKKIAAQDEENKVKATKLKEKLENTELEFKVKVGKDDKVFGSISPKQIKEELEKKNFKIEKKQIEMIESISSLGYHNVKINLYGAISANIKVHVVK